MQGIGRCHGRHGGESEKLHTVEHGVDLKLFDVPVDREADRKAAGFDGFTILSVGHLIPRKGHDLAIRAISHVPDIDLVIIGDGPDRLALEAQADRLGISGRIRFTGQVDKTQLPALLGAADLLVNCSDREGIANVLLEALACGTPVAATAVWGSPEVIVNDDIGLMFDARTIDAIARGLVAAKARSWDRHMIRRHATRYSWGQTAEKHYRVMIGETEPSDPSRH
jgi:teichuronic acid biosynthesis glycosyltransferase TuaC